VASLDGRPLAGEGGESASRGRRLAAQLLDLLVATPFGILGFLISMAVAGGFKAYLAQAAQHAPSLFSPQAQRQQQLVFLLCGLPIMILQWYLVVKTGQSLGKRWLGIKIVKLDGSPVDFVSGVVLRSWVLYGTTALAQILGIPFLMIPGTLLEFLDPFFIFGRQRRTLHDRIAGTKVVYAAKSGE
jgi:uncharacterized RDD family membrane protein YckC